MDKDLEKLLEDAWANRGNLAASEPTTSTLSPEAEQALLADLDARRRDPATHLLVVFAAGAQDLGVECVWCGVELTAHEQSVSSERLQELAQAHYRELGL